MEDYGVPKDVGYVVYYPGMAPIKEEGKAWHPDPDYWIAPEWKTPTASEKQIGGNHYKDMPIQPSEYITKNGIGWYEGNAIKYISRYKQKGGKADIEKAIHYLELLLETLE